MQLVVVLALFASGSTLPGVTTESGTVACSQEQLANQSRAEWEATVTEPAKAPTPPGGTDDWWPIDSVRITGELAPGRRVIVGAENWWDSLSRVELLDTLPAPCPAALDYAPSWLRPQLTSAFRRLGDSAAMAYAQLLLGIPDPYIDEVAFCIATMGPEILTSHVFNPALLLANAEQLYQIDDSLQFADIVEHGSRPGDYWSTVRYAVEQGSDTVWVELPRDIYYFYVVHPVTSDEIPRLDDYVYNMHWREYFFFHADSGFPVLGDYAKRARVVWRRQREVFPSGRPFDPGNSALDVIGNWVTRTNIAGASGNRPIHPNVIAHEHNGNCGEIQDLWTAACRTCLIPTVNCSDPCEDHVWNEFWDGYWLPLASDPSTHIADSGVAYEEAHGGSKRISAVFNWRSDGYWWTVTGHYSNTCSLYVRILDALGRPMDGARVLIYSEGIYGGLSVSTVGCTDASGAVPFELGDLRNFYVQVQSPFGSWPDATNSVRIINTSQTGGKYFSTLYMPYTLAAPRPRAEQYAPDAHYKLRVTVGIQSELDYGYSVSRGAGTGDPDDSIRFYRYYTDEHPGGTCDFFMLDTAGYRSYVGGNRFGALVFGDDAPPQTFDFYPSSWQEPNYVVLSSEDKLFSSRWLDAGVELYIQGTGIAGSGTLQARLDCPSVVRGPVRVTIAGVDGRQRLRIFDSGGRLVRTLNVPAAPVVIDGLPSGVYIIRLEDGRTTLDRHVVVVR